MLHTFQTFSRSNNANRFLELLLRVLRVQTEVFGPGVQILQHYSEVIGPGGGSKYFEVFGPGGAISGGSICFRDTTFAHLSRSQNAFLKPPTSRILLHRNAILLFALLKG